MLEGFLYSEKFKMNSKHVWLNIFVKIPTNRDKFPSKTIQNDLLQDND